MATANWGGAMTITMGDLRDLDLPNRLDHFVLRSNGEWSPCVCENIQSDWTSSGTFSVGYFTQAMQISGAANLSWTKDNLLNVTVT